LLHPDQSARVKSFACVAKKVIQVQIAKCNDDDRFKPVMLEQHTWELELLKEELAELATKNASLQDKIKEISTDDLNTVRKIGQRSPIAFCRLFEIFAVFLGKASQ
jgi:hypothetical protein